MFKNLFYSIGMFFLVFSAYSQEKEKPNVVFILADDYGWMDMSNAGSQFYETPNLDRLAESGIKFTQAYSASPVCSPARVSILTGKYPSKTYNTDWFGAPQPDNIEKHWTRDKPLKPAHYEPNLALEEKTLAEEFLEAGYRTFFAGKWHLGENEKFWPENQGFEINKGGNSKGSPSTGNKYFSPYNNPRLENGPDGEYLPYRLGDETVNFIRNHRDEPFFLPICHFMLYISL